jgi:cholesterol transport system auxiliary component
MTDMNASLRLTRRHVFAAGASTMLLAGCGSLLGPSSPPLTLYRLRPDLRALTDASRVNWQLAVARPTAMQSLDTERIALVRGQMMDYFANAQWTDSTPHLIQALLVEAFEQSGKIGAVGRETDGVKEDFILSSELRDFTAHYDNGDNAPAIVVDIEAKLITPRGEVVAALDATKTVQASQNSVAAVVDGFDQALGAVLEQIVGWALRVRR